LRAERPSFAKSIKRRPAQELASGLVFRPLAHRLVLLLYETRVRAEQLVLLHGALGLLAAFLIARGGDWEAALLLQLVTLLDNADGQLARARGQTSLLGRYLDSEVDFVVHIAIFWALYLRSGSLLAAALGLLILTFVLSLDYNVARLAGGATAQPQPSSRGERLLAGVYRLLFAWQDYLIGALEGWVAARPYVDAERWWSKTYLAILANLGRSSQFVILGVFLLLGRPQLYLLFLDLTAAALLLVYAVRIWRSIRSPR